MSNPRTIPADGADARGVITGYMCLIDYQLELGGAVGGNTVFPSIEDLKRHHDCWEECGIVRVEVRGVAIEAPRQPNPRVSEIDDPPGMSEAEEVDELLALLTADEETAEDPNPGGGGREG
jgi:hypothetical protein